MSNVVIQVENLGKKYLIGHQAENGRYVALRDVLMQNARRLWHTTKDLMHGRPIIQGDTQEEVWALKDVSFEVKKGEVLGIIGRNGAGKSTLLKVLSRITEPTEGRVRIRGRVASLLEVGTGFHPELTGRENIFLNGAILGMTREEVKRNFDEIVAFAEIEKFLDTPVKRYSSGMSVRLAFAVAAHLESEILLVDEVLAVGDAAFQQKCLGKMGDVAQAGKTILFISHNMGAITALVNATILLSNGGVAFVGPPTESIHFYLATSKTTNSVWRARDRNDCPIQIIRAEVITTDNKDTVEFDIFQPIRITVDYEVRKCLQGSVIAVIFHASDGAQLFSTEDVDSESAFYQLRKAGRYRSTVTIPGGLLNRGDYSIRLGSGIPGREIYDNLEALQISVIDTFNQFSRGHRRGYFLPVLSWETKHNV